MECDCKFSNSALCYCCYDSILDPSLQISLLQNNPRLAYSIVTYAALHICVSISWVGNTDFCILFAEIHACIIINQTCFPVTSGQHS